MSSKRTSRDRLLGEAEHLFRLSEIYTREAERLLARSEKLIERGKRRSERAKALDASTA
jgi:hypothetical protein